VRMIQLRCKHVEDAEFLKLAKRFKRLAASNCAIFIINDRVDIAYACEADGVHLGQEDMPISFARKMLKANKIIGKSTHNIKQATAAQREKADYIGLGSIFKTRTKPAVSPITVEAVHPVIKRIRIPLFAIGGINAYNFGALRRIGVKRMAVSQAIMSSKNVELAVKKLICECEKQ